MSVKAIETVYNGYKFRSRLEARWAVFFDTLGVEYRYEPEGYDLDGIWYLPDFFLPRQQCWIEIKPDLPTDEEHEKAIRLCVATSQPVCLFGGIVWFDKYSRWRGYYPLPPNLSREHVIAHFKEHPPLFNVSHWVSPSIFWVVDGRWNTIEYNLERGCALSTAYCVECIYCGTPGIELPSGVWPCHTPGCKGTMKPRTEKLENAYTVARQARFEHGSRGKP